MALLLGMITFISANKNKVGEILASMKQKGAEKQKKTLKNYLALLASKTSSLTIVSENSINDA